MTATSQAISIDETTSKDDADLDSPGSENPIRDQTISFTGLNPNPTSNATITFSVRGDFGDVNASDDANENVLLSVDGFSFGTWLNNNDTDDDITGPTGDAGNQFDSIITGTAIIPLVTLSVLLADGNLNFLFNYSTRVTDFRGSDFAQVQVQYEAETSAVPEPGIIFLFGSGFAGLAAWRYRKNTIKT